MVSGYSVGASIDATLQVQDTPDGGSFAGDMLQETQPVARKIPAHPAFSAARMGMTAEAADYNTRKLQDSPRRYPTFWGPGHDWVPDHNHGGSGMIGLQEMLMQTIGDQILLFPSWPIDWDVDFKLHAPNNTVVEGILKNGELIELKVIPENRRKDIVINLH